MTLSEYVEAECKRLDEYKTTFQRRLSEKSGVSLLTIQNVCRGGKLTNYGKAKDLSLATGGKVKVQELCE